MIWYKETADSDIDWIIEEICSNLTKGQYIEKCIRSRLAEKVFNGDGMLRLGGECFLGEHCSCGAAVRLVRLG